MQRRLRRIAARCGCRTRALGDIAAPAHQDFQPRGALRGSSTRGCGMDSSSRAPTSSESDDETTSLICLMRLPCRSSRMPHRSANRLSVTAAKHQGTPLAQML